MYAHMSNRQKIGYLKRITIRKETIGYQQQHAYILKSRMHIVKNPSWTRPQCTQYSGLLFNSFTFPPWTVSACKSVQSCTLPSLLAHMCLEAICMRALLALYKGPFRAGSWFIWQNIFLKYLRLLLHLFPVSSVCQ